MRRLKLKYQVFLLSLSAIVVFYITRFILENRFGVRILPNILYWFWVIIITEFRLVFGLKSKHTLFLALGITIFGALLSMFNLKISESILRLSFVFWIMGYLFNLLEKFTNKNENI